MEKTMKKKHIAALLIAAAGLLLFVRLCVRTDRLHTADLNNSCYDNPAILMTEVTDSTEIVQEFDRFIETIDSIGVQFATYGRVNSGMITITAYSGGAEVGRNSYDISKISDGEVVDVIFREKKGVIGEKIKIVITAENCYEGSTISPWSIYNSALLNTGGMMTENGQASDLSLKMWLTYPKTVVSPALLFGLLVLGIAALCAAFERNLRRFSSVVSEKETGIFTGLFLMFIVGSAAVTAMFIIYIFNLKGDFTKVPVIAYLLITVPMIFLAEYGMSRLSARDSKLTESRVFGVTAAIFLLEAGFMILTFRDVSYITYPVIYAEDGVFIQRLINEGFVNSALRTRSGSADDFLNVGSYIFLYSALKLLECFKSYDISRLPTVIGVISDLFWSGIAVTAFFSVKKYGRAYGAAAFLAVLLVPLGYTGAEVFGRVLNIVYLWPVLCMFLAMQLFETKYKPGVKSIFFSLLMILCGLSFPVSYGCIGVYLVLGIIIAIKDKKLKNFCVANLPLTAGTVLVIATHLEMFRSQGIGAEMSVKTESLIEFIFARHLLFPFVSYGYHDLNDIVVCLLTVLLFAVLITAFVINIRKNGFLSSFTVFTGINFVCVFGSAIMRIKLSSLFDGYISSAPDRYYYGCNILVMLQTLVSVAILCNAFRKDRTVSVTVKEGAIVLSAMIFMLMINEDTLSQPDLLCVMGYDKGTLSQIIRSSGSECASPGVIRVRTYPSTVGMWYVDLPLIYIAES